MRNDGEFSHQTKQIYPVIIKMLFKIISYKIILNKLING